MVGDLVVGEIDHDVVRLTCEHEFARFGVAQVDLDVRDPWRHVEEISLVVVDELFVVVAEVDANTGAAQTETGGLRFTVVVWAGVETRWANDGAEPEPARNLSGRDRHASVHAGCLCRQFGCLAVRPYLLLHPRPPSGHRS